MHYHYFVTINLNFSSLAVNIFYDLFLILFFKCLVLSQIGHLNLQLIKCSTQTKKKKNIYKNKKYV